MANTKGKIIIVSAIILIAGISTAIIVPHFRKKRILKLIYEKLNDTTSEQGQLDILNEENQLLGSNAFDPKFWKYGKGKVQPNASLLMPTQLARASATAIYNAMAGGSVIVLWESENKIISEFKKLKSKGQVSQVSSAFANTPLSYGDLAKKTTSALTGWTDNENDIKTLTTYINNLPN
jgi:hypothetical protein